MTAGPGRWARILRRHPSRRELAALFDGEGSLGVGTHVAACPRCEAWMGELRRVRAAVRGEPVPASAPARLLRPAWVPQPAVAVVLVAVLLGGALATNLARRAGDTTLASGGERAPVPTGPGPLSTAPAGEAAPPADVATDPAPSPSLGSPTTAPAPAPRPPVSGDGADPSPSGGATQPVAPPTSAPSGEGPGPAGPAGPLRLAVVAPSAGFWAGEGTAVVEAASRAVATANRTGGVGGRPVELVVVRAEDRAALNALPGRADALVGGSPPPPGACCGCSRPIPTWAGPPWSGPRRCRLRWGLGLGADLGGHRPQARVGVVVSGPRDAPFADGLARSVAAIRVNASEDTSCDDEVARLRREGATALAVAGPPQLARRCAAAARPLWGPPDGLLVLPSAAYARLEADPAVHGARTLLGLPWPTSDEPGARRYRAAVGGRAARSYRGLVTFAGVEAAVEVARATGAPSPAPSSGRFRSDLYDLDGGVNRAGAVVVARFGRWTPS